MNAPVLHGIADRIENDEQALKVATELATLFKQDAAQRDQHRTLPWSELEQFSQSGLWAITVPKALGGAEVSSVTLAKVIAIIAAADGSLGQIPQNHYYALEVLRVNGSAEQQRKLYTEVLAGARYGNALAEIGTKTVLDRTTRLTPDGDSFKVNGRKFYATGALYAQRIPTSVVDDEGKQRLAFIPRTREGVTVIDDWSGFGQRTTGSGSVVLDNVAVTADEVVPFQTAFERPTTVGPFAQLLHAAIDTGIARGAYEHALLFVREQARPWPDSGVEHAYEDPLTISDIGRLAIRVAAAEALLERAGETLDNAQQNPTADTVAAASIAIAEARALSTDASLLASNKLIELGGARASLAEHGLDRYWRNARVHTLHDPVRWKYHAIGNYYLNDTLPPRRSYL
ncbi:SfnB family sulfur acquisition oxidoreductase [Pseudomonas sp.]|uniref:SfnB family sulfur acquisition oxidoreductase n=1 Tax=Pseudomonas sp. TaxID=306 RepID=UPI0028AB9E9F|nr:SfnB family sulfur acquisition oxidoreductase [Pseudomonas sp.]